MDLKGLRSSLVFICRLHSLFQMTYLVISLNPGVRSLSLVCVLSSLFLHFVPFNSAGVSPPPYPYCPRLPPFPPQPVQPHWAQAQAWVFLKETVGHALKQTGDLYKRLYCWNLHSLSVMSASKTPVTSFFPPWRDLLDSVSLIFTISQSECMGSLCVS